MQLIGIYLKTLNNEVSKNLKDNWYPFGDFNFDETDVLGNHSSVIDKINASKVINNRLFCIDQANGNKGPSININCIVGKNGAGKSTVISILYRILNNLACKLKELFPEFNKDYTPIWAWGFEATLYYEIDGKLGYIEVYDNNKFCYTEKRTSIYPVRIYYDNNSVLESEYADEQEFFEKLGECLFYTVGTNYSLHSNSVIRFDYNEEIEEWLDTLYHKNDGYFTPVVLVPYRYDSTIIDTEKELKLANERVNTLSILLMKSDNSDFIEGFFPSKIVYELKSEKEYGEEIKNKFVRIYGKSDDIDNYIDLKDAIEKIKGTPKIKKIIETKWNTLLQNKKLSNNEAVYNNSLLYLTYKTIKMCTYYDKYKKSFGEKDLFHFYEENNDECKNILEKIVQTIFIEETDFMNLKIKQCIDFLDNGEEFFNHKKDNHYEIEIDNIKFEKNTYDDIFIKLLPPIFKKEFIYERINENSDKNNLMRISDMSSGEQQMLNSLSYAIYHMKNASNNQNKKRDPLKENHQLYSIPYRNMNLIFDEAELYYHPEYQRQFVDKLLSILRRCHFENSIDSINITIVTHSPFILSDIPNKYILALKDGSKESFKTNTLGANIYDLLNNQFFMESAIGSHIENAINDIIKDYYNFQETKSKKRRTEIKNKYTKSENDFNYYDELINQIGDEYLHETLFDMIDQIREIPFRERRIKEYENKIERLKNETN